MLSEAFGASDQQATHVEQSNGAATEGDRAAVLSPAKEDDTALSQP